MQRVHANIWHPHCIDADACRVLVPKYWTSVSSVSFSFTAFGDSGTGIRGYEWGLGSGPNITNVVAFRPFDGTVQVRISSVPSRICQS